jgi:anti-sigma regulatory factor (Ser/Thr protein kinase)
MATLSIQSDVCFSACVPVELAEMARVRDSLGDALTDCGWDEQDAFRVLVCADEAMANALTHGSVDADSVDIRFRVSPSQAALVVEDHYAGFETFPATSELPDESSEHGRGLILMRALADVFHARRHADRTSVALVFTAGGAR